MTTTGAIATYLVFALVEAFVYLHNATTELPSPRRLRRGVGLSVRPLWLAAAVLVATAVVAAPAAGLLWPLAYLRGERTGGGPW